MSSIDFREILYVLNFKERKNRITGVCIKEQDIPYCYADFHNEVLLIPFGSRGTTNIFHKAVCTPKELIITLKYKQNIRTSFV